jgi:hypothetical protein
MEMGCQLHLAAVLLPETQSLEPNGWEDGRNLVSVRVVRRREVGSCYQFGDDDDDGKDGENCVMSITVCVRRQSESMKLREKQRHK